MTKTLLLIVHSFPPVNNIAAQRFPPMLPVLEAHGWQVWVLTQNATGPLPVPVPEDRIIRIGQHPQEGLRISGDNAFVRGAPLRKAARGLYKAAGLTLHTVESSLVTWGWPVIRQLPAIRARLPHVDAILASYGPAAALWLGRRLAAAYGAPWVADFRDLAAARPLDRFRHARWLDYRLEAWLLESAAALTVCGEHWAATLARDHDRTAHVIYNGWHWPEQVAAGALDTGTRNAVFAGQRPYLYYAGRFYERQLESVGRLLQAIKGTPFQVVLRSLGPSEREAKVMGRARELGVLDQVHLLPPVPHSDVLPEAQSAAANLVFEALETEQTWTSGHLSGKFLQLLPLDPPIVYVARTDAEAGTILERTGKGALCTSVDDIRRQLRRLQARELDPVNPSAVGEYAKIRQGEKLLEIVDAVAARAGAAPSTPSTAASPNAVIRARSDA